MTAVPEPHTPRHRDHAMGNRVVCATPRRGKEISNYSLGDRLGKGAFATVYKAIHLRTAQVAAIKQIPLEKIKSVDTVMEEIELLQDLEHPNIVKYFGFMKDEANLNIVLEYCENGSLAMILHKFGKFPENLVAQYMRQVLEGLVYLHHQGIIHRDIKGANILTTKDGIAKLADFGVAMRIVDGSEPTERPRAVGTPHWMAPEIIQMQEPSTACDIWSLGATIVELKSGQPPYGNRQDIPAMYAIVQQDASGIIPVDSSGSLRDFLTLCFEKNPDIRVAAKDLLKHLWIRKFGGDTRGEKAVSYPEKAVKEWNSPSRRKKLSVPSILDLKSGRKVNHEKKLLDPFPQEVIPDDDYEDDFASLSFFGKVPKISQGSPALGQNGLNHNADSAVPPAKRKHMSDFIETNSSLDEYDVDFDAGSLKIKNRPVKDGSDSQDGSKVDPFLGLEDLLEDEVDEKVLCAQQEAEKLLHLITSDQYDLVIAFKRLGELVASVPAVSKTLDQIRLLPKSLTLLASTSSTPRSSKEAIIAFLELVDICIRVEKSADFVTSFCIAGGLSFILKQSEMCPRLVLSLLYRMSDLHLGEGSVIKQLAYREDAIAVVCLFFEESSEASDLTIASSIILDMFKVYGPRRRANLWHHFNTYGLFVRLVNLLHLPSVLHNDAENAVANNFYSLITSFSKNPQELIAETVNHKILRRLMRAFILLPVGSRHRTVLLEFFKNTSTLVAILDSMQKGNIAPHLIAALKRAMCDPSIPAKEAHTTANCLVPALFNYSRINRLRQREVARYGLLVVLQKCIRKYPSLREFAFPTFSALAHAGHEECWNALWEADALHSFIELITESGWQAMAIAAVAAWIQAQPKLVGPKFIPHISVINDSLLSTTGSAFEAVLSSVASLFYENRSLCSKIPVHGLFKALKKQLTVNNTTTNSASLVQALQIVVWVMTANTDEAVAELNASKLVLQIEALNKNKDTPVPCIKLIGQIMELYHYVL